MFKKNVWNGNWESSSTCMHLSPALPCCIIYKENRSEKSVSWYFICSYSQTIMKKITEMAEGIVVRDVPVQKTRDEIMGKGKRPAMCGMAGWCRHCVRALPMWACMFTIQNATQINNINKQCCSNSLIIDSQGINSIRLICNSWFVHLVCFKIPPPPQAIFNLPG